MFAVPEGDLLHSEGIIVDACGGESDSQHVLRCGDVVWGCDTVQICHIAKKNMQHNSVLHFRTVRV